MKGESVSIIGAGKVGSALAHAFADAGHKINLIVSLTEESASALAATFNCGWSVDPIIDSGTDFVVVAVPDSIISSLLSELRVSGETIVCHTAGSIGLDVFEGTQIDNRGIIYPLQTFSINRQPDIKEIPILIESDKSTISHKIMELVGTLSDKVYEVDSDRRRMIHLAAVFVCNFVNHMYRTGEMITDKTDLPFEILEPLIRETLNKAQEIGPENAQTGPAARNDRITIEKHLNLLSFSPTMKDMYEAITNSIINQGSKSLNE